MLSLSVVTFKINVLLAAANDNVLLDRYESAENDSVGTFRENGAVVC